MFSVQGNPEISSRTYAVVVFFFRTYFSDKYRHKLVLNAESLCKTVILFAKYIAIKKANFRLLWVEKVRCWTTKDQEWPEAPKHTVSTFLKYHPKLEYFSLILFIKPEEIQLIGKGQLTSKGLFGFFNSPPKRRINFCPSRLGQKLTFSSSIFWEN